METDVLRYFQQIADGLTVTETADIFRITQPAVSRSLRRLEEEVGAPLLERSGRNLRLTHAGRVFKGHLDASLHALDDGLAAVEELLDPDSGVVHVAFQPSLGAWLVPRLIASFRRTHPNVRFGLTSVGDVAGSALVVDGRADLQLTARRPRHSEVSWQRLLRQPLALAVPSDHRLAARSVVALEELREDEFVMLTPAWELRGLVDDLCQQAGFSPIVAFEENDMIVVRGFVAAGLGVAVVPRVPGDGVGSGGGAERLIPLSDPAAFREVGVAWASQRRLLPSVGVFREHAVKAGRRLARAYDS